MSSSFIVQYSLFVPDFNVNCISLKGFLKNIQISNFVKIRLVGDELFHAD